ncbi:MAG: glycosyltransferase family 39 protein [Bdellovibrionaceae bacterium]|nr:glycosyltransferase family 39 protein [Pseudobdellovibrionaceae bacterium]
MSISYFLQVGILLGFSFSEKIYDDIWIIDALTMHLPGAINFSNVLNGISDLRHLSSTFDKYYLIQFVTGTFFYLLGVHPFVSGLSLAVIKLFTVSGIYVFGKKLFNSHVALMACTIYIFSPTILFYTTAFYKETLIQALVIWISYFYYLFYTSNFKYKYLIPLSALNLALANERVYLMIFFIISIAITILFQTKKKLSTVLFITAFVSGVVYVFMNNYRVNKFKEVVLTFKNLKIIYNSYPDIKFINKELPYPVATVKLFFSPYFTFNKFSIFKNFSSILTWGSFLNHIVLLLFLYSMIYLKRIKYDWPLISPFVFLLLLFGYLAPYSGRIRDSFYPIVCLYAAHSIFEIKIGKKIETPSLS